MNSKFQVCCSLLFKQRPIVWSSLNKSTLISLNQTARMSTILFPTSTSRLISIPVLNGSILLSRRGKLRGGPGYTNYGHRREPIKMSKFKVFYVALVFGSLSFLLLFDFEGYFFRGQDPEDKMNEIDKSYNRFFQSKAKEIKDKAGDVASNEEDGEESDDESGHDEIEVAKKKTTFRDRKIIQYENRIRMYSTPDKVFRYFATLKVWNDKLEDYEIFMTPDDFIRSMTIGVKQPEGLGLDSFNKFDPKMQKLELSINEDSIFKALGQQGLISFSDYMFLTTLLSTPPRHFEIAFHMFDLDGNGNIDLEEFEQLQAIIRNKTALGKRHKDTYMTGSVIRENSSLNEYFFGSDLKDLLTVDKFVDFQKRFQEEVIRMEFELYNVKVNPKTGKKFISELSFSETILAYAGFNKAKTKKILKNISKLYGDNSEGIYLQDYENFFKVMRSIQEINTALNFYAIAGASIDKDILKHVSKTVAGVVLGDHLVDVIFNLFDVDGDGKLSSKEFLTVMKKRMMRGLQNPKDTGFVNFIEAVSSCTKEKLFHA